MTLNFPNPSRSFDATRNCVRFWGYDSAIEIALFVEVDALRKLCPEMSNVEAGFLKAFDAERKQIHKIANKAYVRGRSGSYAYRLAAEDF